MRQLVESLRRLHKIKQIIDLEKIDTLLSEEKITQEEYDYIVAE